MFWILKSWLWWSILQSFFPKNKFSHCYQQQSLVTGIWTTFKSCSSNDDFAWGFSKHQSNHYNNSPPQDHPRRESIKRKASTNLYKAESNVFGSHVFMFRGIESWWRYSCNSLWWISNKSRFKVLITYWELSKNICWYMLPNGKLMVMDMYKRGMFVK